MAATEVATTTPRKGGLGKALVIAAAFAVGAAAAGGGAAYAVLQLGRAPAAAASSSKPAEAAAAAAAAKLDYVELDNAFTSNLVDTGRYLQLKIAVSTTGGAPVMAALAKHRLAVVSAVLAVLSDLGESDIANRAAKDKLRRAVRNAINEVLRHKANVEGIDEVYITSLVVQ